MSCFGSLQRKIGRIHILVVSQYFYPEAFRINDMAVEWVRRGYRVTVLTGIPNYPEGRFFDGYGFCARRCECWNGVKIIRLPVVPRGKGGIRLVLNYASFACSSWIWNKITRLRADLVFTYEVSPMTQALAGCWHAGKNHVPHYLYVTDLWPENVESVTGIRHKAVILPLQMMSDYIYRHSERILTSSRSFMEPVRKRGIDASRIEFWPQYAEDFYRPAEKKGSLLPQDGVPNLVFAGNAGRAQGLDILVRAAVLLRRENIHVRFYIIGNGRCLGELKRSVKSARVERYFGFIPQVPAEEVPRYFAFADALLITLAESDVFSRTIPAKTQSCMACGRPVLVSADGEVQEIIKAAGAGLCSGAGDACEFVGIIKEFLDMGEGQRKQLAENALSYSGKYFNKEQLLGRLDEIFMQEGRHPGKGRNGT